MAIDESMVAQLNAELVDAAERGLVVCVKLLLDAGANVNACKGGGNLRGEIWWRGVR